MKRHVGRKPANEMPVAEQLLIHWNKLAEQDATSAYDGLLALAEMPDACVPFLAERIKPVEAVSDAQFAKWIADLDADSFDLREETTAKLLALDEIARPALENALKGKPSAEVHNRIKGILAELDGMNYPPELMWKIRAVEVLELIGDRQAHQLLERLAAGAPGAILTTEAKSALARWKQVY
jgi:hypothetical protein